jgi:hypothetical protein
MGSTTELRNYYKEVIIMRTMKKTIAFVLAFAMTFATAFSAVGKGVAANAAVGITSVNGAGEFKASGVVKELQVAVVKVKGNTASIVKSWDTYTGDGSVTGKVTLSPKKDTYVAFRTVDGFGYSAPIFYEIQANTGKYKATVKPNSAKTGYDMTITKDGLKYTGNYTLDGVAVKDADKKTEAASITDDQTLNNGATRTIVPLGDKTNLSQKLTTIKYDGNDCTVAGFEQANAKAITVKIKKRAGAPKASINYKTGKITIPKGCMYKIITKDGDWAPAFTEATVKEVKPIDVTTPNLDAGIVQVYKKGTDKLIASKTGSTTYSIPVALREDTDVSIGTRDADKKTIAITNSTGYAIEYFVGDTVTESSKWTLVKGANGTIKNTKETGKVWFRKAANAKSCELPGRATLSIDWAPANANNG